MKISSFLFLLFIASFGCSQTFIWSSEIEISDGYGNLRPRIALASNNNPVVVWGGGTGTQPIYVSRLNGNSFSTPIAVTPIGVDPYTAFWVGPDIAAKGDSIWVVFDTDLNNGFDVYTVHSNDGGLTFEDTVNVSGYSGLNRFPSIGSDQYGNVAVSYMSHDNGWSNPRYVVSNSNDAGLSWQTSVNASEAISGTEVCDCCPSEIILDGNKQALLFRDNNNNLRDVWSSFSYDGGQTFGIGADIDDGNWVLNACPSTGADGLFINDSLIVTWMSAGFGSSKVMITSVSVNNAVSSLNWDMPGIGGVSQNYPRIAGDQNTIGVCYQQYSSGNNDCYFAYSFIGDTKLDTAVLLNTSLIGNQTNPDVIYSNETFHFVYQDAISGNVMYRTAKISTVNIEENNVNVTVYPNPSSEIIWIEGGQQNKITVVDASGRLIETSILQNNLESINCSTWSTGSYYYKLCNDLNVVKSGKIIIKR